MTTQETLDTLQRQLVAHRDAFEKWKLDNALQTNKESYNDYVKQVQQWENQVVGRIQHLQAISAKTAVAGPLNIDAILDKLLDDVNPQEFLLAMMRMHSSDKNFIYTVMSNFKQIQTQNNTPVSVSVATNVRPAFLFDPTVAPPAAARVAPTFAAPGVVGASAVPMMISQPTIPTWSQVVPPPKPFRPPSPVRDYRNPSGMPFRDFSQ